MAQPYPISRETREEAIFFGDGGASYGPFGLKIFDSADVLIYTKATGATVWTEQAVTITKASDAPFDEFSIAFAGAIPNTTKIKVISARVHERTAGLMQGVQLNPDALEKELSKQGTILQELSRDRDRAIKMDYDAGANGYSIAAGLAVGATLMLSAGGVLVAGPNASDIAGAQGYAAQALVARDGAILAATAAEDAKNGLIGALGLIATAVQPNVSPNFTVNVGIGSTPRFTLDIVKNITAPIADSAIQHVANKSNLLATDIYAPQVPAGYYYADGIRSVMEVSDDSTVTHTSAFGAYYINKSVQGGSGGTEANAVGYFSLGIAAVNNSATWGLNTCLNDNTVNGLATLVGRKLIGWEGDFQVNGASTIQGAALIIQGDGTPAGANGITLSHQTTTTARWQRAFVTGDGSCSVAAMVVGANQVSGSNIGSQPVLFNYFNASGIEYQQKIQAVNGGFNFTSSALTDGIYLAASNSNPTIGITGSSASANLNIRAAGTGRITFANSTTYFASTGELCIGDTKVLGARDTGWVAMTGGGNKTTSYDVSSVTLVQLAGRVAQLQSVLTSQGIIGP
ncbi:hypothetical protein GOZ83_06335 [Agrobacterium vitis]|uniref:hypothetical protein n=1 Tax=Agrobacterium vitis TaxID=373 RepID=UPI0012E8E655|nr:hypothetical protein [Agrobacterium vitis]MVA44700.1 hypothetical protein [Agrobacterium vitis]